jgi:hypothetical protein
MATIFKSTTNGSRITSATRQLLSLFFKSHCGAIEFGRAATSALHFFLDIESETQWMAGSRRLDYAKRCFGITR